MGGNFSIGPLEFKAYDHKSPEYTGNRNLSEAEKHRCHDRIEDLVKTMSGGWDQYNEGNVMQACRALLACMTSPEGLEPNTPYNMLTPRDKSWIDLAARAERQEQQQEQQAGQQQQSSSSSGSSRQPQSSSSSRLKGLG